MKITHVQAENWEGVYAGDKILLQGHSINAVDLLSSMLGLGTLLAVSHVEAGSWLSVEGVLPDSLEEFYKRQG